MTDFAQEGSVKLPSFNVPTAYREKTLDQLRSEINTAHRNSEHVAYTSLEYARDAGFGLNEVKSRMKHGEWLPWLRDNFEGSKSTAYDYMTVARRWGDLSNFQRAGNLSLRDGLRILSGGEGEEEQEPPKDDVEAEARAAAEAEADRVKQEAAGARRRLKALGDPRLVTAEKNGQLSLETALLLGEAKTACGPETYAALWEHGHESAQVRKRAGEIRHLLKLARSGQPDDVTADLVTLVEDGSVKSVIDAHKHREEERKEEERKERQARIDADAAAARAAVGESATLEIKPGCWYELGDHLLYCGDTRDQAFVDACRSSAFAFADPPYNAGVAAWDSDFVWNHDYLTDACQVVAVTPGGWHLDEFFRRTEMTYAWTFACYIKNGMTKGAMGFGNWIAVPLFSERSVHRNARDLLEITIKTGETDDTDYKGRKPYELVAHLMNLYSQPGDTVVDPFVGSGTTLLVAQKEGRRSVCGDIQPSCIEETISRWQDLTGGFAREHRRV